MATYSVKVLEPRTGRVFVERMVANNPSEVAIETQTRGLTLLNAEPVNRGLKMTIGKPRVKLQEIALFARMLATLVSSGIPLVDAISSLADDEKNPTLRDALIDTVRRVEQGAPVHEAFDAQEGLFPPIMISMIEAGDAGGFLDQALENVANAFEADVRLRSDIKSAATYPLVVLVMALVIGAAMLIFVLPSFVGTFDSFDAELPGITLFAMWLSEVAKVTALPGLGLAIAFSVWWRKNRYKEGVRSRIDPVKLRLPVFGPIIRKVAISRVTRNLGVMLASGVPLLTALGKCAPTAGNTVIERVFQQAGVAVESGSSLGEPLEGAGELPALATQLIKSGEQSGELPTMLGKACEFYDDQVTSETKQLSSTLEPFLIVLIGAIVGFLVIAMYMPMFTIFDQIG